MPPAATKSKKLFLASRSKSRPQGHWPWCHLKGHHKWSMHAKYEVSISYGSKVIAKVKVDNRQINRQTHRQTGQKQYAPDHSIRGHKNNNFIVMNRLSFCFQLWLGGVSVLNTYILYILFWLSFSKICQSLHIVTTHIHVIQIGIRTQIFSVARECSTIELFGCFCVFDIHVAKTSQILFRNIRIGVEFEPLEYIIIEITCFISNYLMKYG